MAKIRSYEELRISIGNGFAELHIAESSDGTYNITISEYGEEVVRVGIPDSEGITYMYWKKIKEVMNEHEYGKKGGINSNEKSKKSEPGRCENSTI